MEYRIDLDTPEDDREEVVRTGPAVDFLAIGSPLQGLTRSKLWQITSRHMGLCNNAFWYPDLKQPENGSIYINPARVTPHPNAAGYLDHWRVDEDETSEGVRREGRTALVPVGSRRHRLLRHGLVYALMKATLNTAAIGAIKSSSGRLGHPDADQGRLHRRRGLRLDAARTPQRHGTRRQRQAHGPTPQGGHSADHDAAGGTQADHAHAHLKEDIYEIWGVPRSQTGSMTGSRDEQGDRQS
jgi:hypothetical protein